MAKTKVEAAPSNRDDALLSMKEAAAQIGVSPTTMGRWATQIGRKRIKTVRFPSGIRKIRQSVVNQILLATGENGDATEELEYDDQ